MTVVPQMDKFPTPPRLVAFVHAQAGAGQRCANNKIVVEPRDLTKEADKIKSRPFAVRHSGPRHACPKAKAGLSRQTACLSARAGHHQTMTSAPVS